MSTMSDGVNKIFTLHHEYGSMNIEGFRTREDAAIQLLRAASGRSIPPGCTPDEYWKYQIEYWQGMKLTMLAEVQRVQQEQLDEQAAAAAPAEGPNGECPICGGTLVIEEGDQRECEDCNKRENAREQQQSSAERYQQELRTEHDAEMRRDAFGDP